jgi:hypothetical protein
MIQHGVLTIDLPNEIVYGEILFLFVQHTGMQVYGAYKSGNAFTGMLAFDFLE